MKTIILILIISLILPTQIISLNVNGCILTYAVKPTRRFKHSRKHSHKQQQCLYQFLNLDGDLNKPCLQLNSKLNQAKSYSPPGLDLALGSKVTMHIVRVEMDQLILDEAQQERVNETGFNFQAMGVHIANCEKDIYSDDKTNYQIVMSKESQNNLFGMSVRKRMHKRRHSHHK